MSRLLGLAIKGGYMKTAKEFPPSTGAEFPGYPEDQDRDQESCSRMDSEGCPNGGADDDGRRATERGHCKAMGPYAQPQLSFRRYC
jgi:hypothetical protein